MLLFATRWRVDTSHITSDRPNLRIGGVKFCFYEMNELAIVNNSRFLNFK